MWGGHWEEAAVISVSRRHRVCIHFEVAVSLCLSQLNAVTERPCVMTVYILRPVVYVLLRTSQPSCQLPGLYFITSS